MEELTTTTYIYNDNHNYDNHDQRQLRQLLPLTTNTMQEWITTTYNYSDNYDYDHSYNHEYDHNPQPTTTATTITEELPQPLQHLRAGTMMFARISISTTARLFWYLPGIS